MTDTDRVGRSITLDDVNKLFAWCRNNDVLMMEREPDAAQWLYAMKHFTNNDLRWLCESIKKRQTKVLLPLSHCVTAIKMRHMP